MKYYLIYSVLVCSSLASLAGENVIRNGDFENGKSKWRGDMVVEYETPEKINKICRIDADEEERIEITQKVAICDPKKLTFKFRVKRSTTYETDMIGWSIVGVKTRNKGGVMGGTVLLRNYNDWTIIDKELSEVFYEDHHVTVSIKAHSANSGSIYIDDVELIQER